jgi:hypothetical protein
MFFERLQEARLEAHGGAERTKYESERRGMEDEGELDHDEAGTIIERAADFLGDLWDANCLGYQQRIEVRGARSLNAKPTLSRDVSHPTGI